jgi:hypothetical protein
MYASNYKTVATSKREMLISETTQSGCFQWNTLFGNNTLAGYGRTYFVNLYSILNIKTHLMKSTFIASFLDGICRYFGCGK